MSTMSQFKGSGLQADKKYEAVVVRNNDGTKNQRVQARIPGMLDEIPDRLLPWAIPGHLSHLGGASSTGGEVNVPDVGSKVWLEFQDGSIDFPIYYSYGADDSTRLREGDVNYPMRHVSKLSNGCLVVIDKSTDEVFIYNPGTTHIHVVGDVNMEVRGNVVERIRGDYTRHVDGRILEKCGSRHSEVLGSDTFAAASRYVYTDGSDDHGNQRCRRI